MYLSIQIYDNQHPIIRAENGSSNSGLKSQNKWPIIYNSIHIKTTSQETKTYITNSIIQ
jgi:hypothetical protein